MKTGGVEILQTRRSAPDAITMHDCFVCALPAGVQGEFTYNQEPWVTVLCANGHWIVMREHELPASVS